MNLFRWKRLFVRALAPALLCAALAGWGVYVLTGNERPSYRSQAQLATGLMSGADKAEYVRDLVINEIEGIQNLARSFETREELATRLLATFLALRQPDPAIISARAYRDLHEELDPAIVRRHARSGNEELIYLSLVAERDSLRRYGEANARHPLVELLYGDNDLVGIEHLGEALEVHRVGLSDILEVSYTTVDAAWCKRTLDTHIRLFLDAHEAVKVERTDGALAYFRRATAEARAQLADAEERLRNFSATNRIINYYEQTRAIATERKDIDQQYTEELMRAAGAVESIRSLELRLADRVNLVQLNRVIDERRRDLAELGRQEARLRVMSPDSSRGNTRALDRLGSEQARLRRELSDDVVRLQGVYQGPEGIELSRLLNEWIAAVLVRESSRGKVQVLEKVRRDFDDTYEEIAYQGSTLKKIEREVHIAEEDYLENLTSLNDALKREHSTTSTSELRLVDAPTLPTLPQASRRLMMVAAGALLGGSFPFVLAVVMELLSGGLTSFEEAERRSGLSVVGGVARWSTTRRVLRKRYRKSLDSMTGDLLWQGIRARTGQASARHGPQLLAVTSLQPGAGKTRVTEVLAQRLAERGFRVAVIADRAGALLPSANLDVYTANVLSAGPQSEPWELCGLRQNEWAAYRVVLWELPSVATGRLPVDLVRRADNVLLVQPPSKGWTKGHDSATDLLSEAAGAKPLLVLNGMAADVLLHLWGASWGELRAWAAPVQGGPATAPVPAPHTPSTKPLVVSPLVATPLAPRPARTVPATRLAPNVPVPDLHIASLQDLQTAAGTYPDDAWAAGLAAHAGARGLASSRPEHLQEHAAAPAEDWESQFLLP